MEYEMVLGAFPEALNTGTIVSCCSVVSSKLYKLITFVELDTTDTVARFSLVTALYNSYLRMPAASVKVEADVCRSVGARSIKMTVVNTLAVLPSAKNMSATMVRVLLTFMYQHFYVAIVHTGKGDASTTSAGRIMPSTVHSIRVGSTVVFASNTGRMLISTILTSS